MLLGRPCANPPPHFLCHLHLVRLTSCSASLFFTLLVLLLVGDTYGPRVDRVGDGKVDVLTVLRGVLQTAFRWDVRPLRAGRSAKLLLSDIAAITLLLLVKRWLLSLASTSSFSLYDTKFAKPFGATNATRSRCLSTVASLFVISLIESASWQWLNFYAALIF